MKTCLICGNVTKSVFKDLWYHLKLIDIAEIKTAHQYFKGNLYLHDGNYLSALDSHLSLISPLYKTIRHWKHRKKTLNIPTFYDVEQ